MFQLMEYLVLSIMLSRFRGSVLHVSQLSGLKDEINGRSFGDLSL